MNDVDKLKLTQDQRNQIANTLTEKGARHACPACGTNQWLVGEHILRGDIFSSGTVLLGGPSYPLVFVVCQNCFFVRPHLAIPMGIVQEPVPATTAEQEEKADG